jgi:hypothetical protein
MSWPSVKIGSNGGHVFQTARRQFVAPHQSHWMAGHQLMQTGYDNNHKFDNNT